MADESNKTNRNSSLNSVKPKKRNRKGSLPVRHIQSRISVEELRSAYKRQLSLPKERDVLPIYDPLAKSDGSKSRIRGKTGVVYDDKFTLHSCLWDEEFLEIPERYTAVIDRCNSLGLIARCMRINSRTASKEEILKLHSERHYNLLQETANESDCNKLKEFCGKYDSIRINQDTFDSALLAVGCTLDLVSEVIAQRIQNGMAIVRPPGHHAMHEEYCGFSFFNQVALAAEMALSTGIERILIVDWDVHHGQATQRMFYDDPRVLYFSIHRYENGAYWPHLRESDCDYVGSSNGIGRNVNIPLNQIGMKNEDYLAVFHQVLMPMAYEFDPDLVLVSSGYDAAIGDCKGEMVLTPCIYSHLTSMLMGLAEGKVVVVLEGGYCIKSLAEGAALTLKTLLGDPCPILVDTLGPPSLSIIQTIQDVVTFHNKYWNCFNHINTLIIPEDCEREFQPPIDFEVNKIQTLEVKNKLNSEIERLNNATILEFAENHLCLSYDPDMEKHFNTTEDAYPERPARTIEIMKVLEEFGLLDRIKRLKSRVCSLSEIGANHSSSLISLIDRLPKMTQRERNLLEDEYTSIYFSEGSARAAFLAAGCLLEVVDDVLSNRSRSGLAIVRPPGHHAEYDMPHGFCLFNNVAIGASYAKRKFGLKRILILDWDIHHGNGTQHMFINDPEVLYVSIHLYENGKFFPYSKEADNNYVGISQGRGYNVNIPWNKSGVGDGDYISALMNIVMPIAYEYNPELVLISAGFDAAINDPLGGCNLTPECFGHMTHHLSKLANGQLILTLEGGYNLASTSLSMALCAKALLGDPLPPLGQVFASKGAAKTFDKVCRIQEVFWKSLKSHPSMFEEHIPQASLLKETSHSESPFHDEYKSTDEVEVKKPLKIEQMFDDVRKPNLASKADDVTPKPESAISDTEFFTPPESPEFENLSNKNDIENLSSQLCAMKLKTDDIPLEDAAEGAVGGVLESKMEDFDFSSVTIADLIAENCYAVVPLSTCPHLVEVNDIPQKGFDVFSPCTACGDTSENWICLTCFEIYCGRYVNGHMVQHTRCTDHSMVLSFADLSIWCYGCESYVHNEVVLKCKQIAHKQKFGHDMPHLF